MEPVTKGLSRLAIACGHHTKDHIIDGGSPPEPIWTAEKWPRSPRPNSRMDSAQFIRNGMTTCHRETL
jgi:hypothetical protein